MLEMGRVLWRLAAVLANVALVAALPAPCGCAPQRAVSGHAAEHACCVPPTGVSAVDRGCCNENPETAPAVPSPGDPGAAPSVAFGVLRVEVPLALLSYARPSALPSASPPPAVLRI